MPSFAELKEKAAKAKDAGASKIQNTRDRYSSVPLKNTNWDPYNKQAPPPPPPPRTIASTRPGSSAPPPPPPRFGPPPTRSTSSLVSESASHSPSPPPPPPARRGFSNASGTPSPPPPRQSSSSPAGPPPLIKRSTRPDQAVAPAIDWSNLSPQDKEVFFSWLDEFFERSYGISPPRK